tara:strand:- start:937 stop:1128 length:192 start_codon:yes stop_codon:yes gene_type:complete
MTERQKLLEEISIARSMTFSKMAGVYNEPPKPAVRPGADNHEKLPSRVGNKLHYADGSIKSVK